MAATNRDTTRGLAGRLRRAGTAALLLIAAGAALAMLVVAFVVDRDRDKVSVDPGPRHVHGLGVNPRDEALFVASHTGLYRIGRGERSARRVSDRHQDTMGFTIVGPGRFLGSGHPDWRDNLPPRLGLIESRNGRKELDAHLAARPGRFPHPARAGRADRRLRRDERPRTDQPRWRQALAPAPLRGLAGRPRDRAGAVAGAAGDGAGAAGAFA